MSKVSRKIREDWGWDGEVYEVSCAVEADGVSSPAATFIDHLRSGTWPDETVDLPDLAQVRDLDKFKVLTRMLAEEGRLPKNHFNRLDDGVWEIKIGIFRVSFYDTDGEGNYYPKAGDPVRTWDHKVEFQELPEFDEFIRLGHAFNKRGQRTTPMDIAETKRVRTEDLKHDEPDRQDERNKSEN